jgi:hypothetical protein
MNCRSFLSSVAYQCFAIMGLLRIFFLEGPFWRFFGRDDLFFFFWSSRPILSDLWFYGGYQRCCGDGVVELPSHSVATSQNFALANELIDSLAWFPGLAPRCRCSQLRPLGASQPSPLRSRLVITRPSWCRVGIKHCCRYRSSSAYSYGTLQQQPSKARPEGCQWGN